MDIRVGTSGYNYFFWKKSFYPENIYQNDYLKYYCKFFNTVEINSTFYQYPKEKNIERWYSETPQDFKFVIKMNRLVTHYKKLIDVNDKMEEFFSLLKPLKNKLQCILFQFGASFKYNNDNLARLKKLNLTMNVDYAFEFRDKSWFNKQIYNLFNKRNWMLVITHNTGDWKGLEQGFNPQLEDIERTKLVQNKFYIRMHGPDGIYVGMYDKHLLMEIVRFIKKTKSQKGYILFNNTDSTTKKLPDAVNDALHIKKLLIKGNLERD